MMFHVYILRSGRNGKLHVGRIDGLRENKSLAGAVSRRDASR
jgi:hypothetical protein